MSALLFQAEDERDRLLLARHRSGDAMAFAELYEHHRDRLLRYLRGVTDDWHAAEDIAQEAFVRAFCAAARLHDSSRFYPWLRVIAQRVAVDHLRRNGKVVIVAGGFEGAAAEAVDQHLIAECEAEALRAAFERLRPRHAQVLRWQAEGFSYEDIARRLDASLTTVPPLLHRARQALKREYLAMTLGERVIVLPTFTGIAAATRRWRDRLSQYLGWFPDTNSLCAPVACLAISVGTVIAPIADLPSFGRTADAAPAVASSGGDARSQAPETAFGRHRTTVPGLAQPAQPPASDPTPRGTVIGVADVGTNQERRAWQRERARQMPYYYEFGDVGFAADPDAMRRDLESTSRGDLRWTRGRCHDNPELVCEE